MSVPSNTLCKWFAPAEFRSCTPSCEITDMNFQFLRQLDLMREYAGIPIYLGSAYRSVDYEKSKSRSGTSSHTKGIAVDIGCTSSYNRQVYIDAAIKAGFKRIGIAETFIHLDSDFSKPCAIWLYPAHGHNTEV